MCDREWSIIFDNFKAKVKALKKQIKALYLVYLHKGVQWYKKAFVLLILIYALSPVDLIPDFIPILGVLDDLIIVPLIIIIAVKIIPKDIWQECLEQSEHGVTIDEKYKIAGLVLVSAIWILVIYKIVTIFLK